MRDSQHVTSAITNQTPSILEQPHTTYPHHQNRNAGITPPFHHQYSLILPNKQELWTNSQTKTLWPSRSSSLNLSDRAEASNRQVSTNP